MKCTYIHLCLFHSKPVQHIQDLLIPPNNSTWCQNRGCICISSTRITYGRIHATSCIHPVMQTRTIILQTELFPKKRREKIQGEILQPSFKCSVSTYNPSILQELQCFHMQSSKLQVSTLILHTELILSQEILQLQDSSRADRYKASSSNCSPCIHAFYMAEQGSKHPYSIPGLPGFQLILHTEKAF